MPELPDLQAFSKNLNKQLQGKLLKQLKVLHTAKLKVAPNVLKKTVEKQRLQLVFREGKELRFAFDNGHVLGMHLMQKGQLHLLSRANDKKNTILEMHFTDGTIVVLADYQRMASVSLDPEPWDAPDALSSEVNGRFLKDRLKKKINIKKLLLDQHIIRGIGNAYADEILWKAGIAPASIANKIPELKIKKLVLAIKSVLKDAEKQILKAQPDIISGEVRHFLKVHHAGKTISPTGSLIRKEMLNSRVTYWTDEQELYV